MALQVRVAPSKVVLQNLFICVILFYTVYYVVLSVGCMVLQVYELSVLAPFDFKTCPSWLNTSYKVLLISTEVTYFVCGLLFVLIVEEWVWDYAISVTILHVAITSTVMLEFPLTSHWWAALAVIVMVMMAFILFNSHKPSLHLIKVLRKIFLELMKGVDDLLLRSAELGLRSLQLSLLFCGSGLISMICGGQALAYCLFKDNFIYPELDGF